MKDDDSKLGSNNLRSSNILDLEDSGNVSHHRESMQRMDLLNRSLSGQDTKIGTRNPELVKSIRSEQNGLHNDEKFKESLDKPEAYNWSSKSGHSAKASKDENKEEDHEYKEEAYDDQMDEEEENYEQQFE